MFINFANFYRHFTQGFSRIAILLTFLFKTTGSSKSVPKIFETDDNKVVGGDGGRANRTVMNLAKNEKSRKLTYMPNIETIEELNFLTSNAKKTFNYL